MGSSIWKRFVERGVGMLVNEEESVAVLIRGPSDRFRACTEFARALAHDVSWFALLERGGQRSPRT